MNKMQAMCIFIGIKYNKFSDAEKLEAIRTVVNTPTHNSVRKCDILEAIRWLLDLYDEITRYDASNIIERMQHEVDEIFEEI